MWRRDKSVTAQSFVPGSANMFPFLIQSRTRHREWFASARLTMAYQVRTAFPPLSHFTHPNRTSSGDCVWAVFMGSEARDSLAAPHIRF
jgi:hypothetical protein